MLISDERGLRTEAHEVRFLGFPEDLAGYHEGELMLHHNGRIRQLAPQALLTSLYGKLEGQTKYRNFAAVSEDGGFTWHYRGTAADEDAFPDASAGPSESDIEILGSGDLLCVYRIGASQDYGKSYSRDEGHTWTAPIRMEGMRSVQPRLCRLANGALILSGGKPGLFVWVSADGHGEVWQSVNLAKHHNHHMDDDERRFTDALCAAENEGRPRVSTTYTSIDVQGDDRLLISYDRLSNDWSGAPGPLGSVDQVFTVSLTVSI